MNPCAEWTIREIDRKVDAVEVLGLDTSYTTEAAYVARSENGAITLDIEELPARTLRFPLDLDCPKWDQGFVAVADGAIRAFIATRYEAWNRRLTIWHFYVDGQYRRRGAGRALLEAALAAGKQAGALTAWAETSNINAPGIAAYRQLGLAICGFDLTLYRGTASADQFAVYLARELA